MAQLVIGKNTVNGNSTLMDFNSDSYNTKGIILPALSQTPTFTITAEDLNGQHPNNGTFIFDRTMKRIRMFENNQWVTIGITEGEISTLKIPTNLEEKGEGIIIGSEETKAKGVFVLESPDKAMILPYIADPHLNVKGAYPGMICYDTSSNTMAFFDGANWSYYQ